MGKYPIGPRCTVDDMLLLCSKENAKFRGVDDIFSCSNAAGLVKLSVKNMQYPDKDMPSGASFEAENMHFPTRIWLFWGLKICKFPTYIPGNFPGPRVPCST